MSRRLPLFAVPLFFCFLVVTYAQQTSERPAAPPAPAKTANARKPSAAERSRIAQQKAMALSILLTLANDAGSYPDQTLRARTLSRIADALWEADPEQGRSLFRKAWDAASEADQESQRRVEEERRQQEAQTRSFAINLPPDLRSEVLRLAARRDRAMGEELLDKLTESRKQEATDAAATERREALQTPAALRQRLRLANQLLETDVERAMQFADLGLATVTMEGLSFLSNLRTRNAEAADQRYSRFLSIAASDLQSDANTVSLLSSYLFHPHLFVTFQPDGGQQSSQSRRLDPPQVAPQLRTAFFNSAARVLLRPSPSREQDKSTAGIQGKYLVIRRLLPLFEQYASKEVTEQLRAEAGALGQATRQELRDRQDDDEGIARGLVPERKPEDIEKSLLDRLERAKTSEERDGLYLQLALRTAEKGDMRARDFADKIEDSEIRKQAKPYVDLTLSFNVVDKKDVEKALFLSANGELNHVEKVWLLTQTAKRMAPADRERALEILSDAAGEARRIGGSDPDRARALLAVANGYLAIERGRAWDTMLDAVKASNSAEGFTGEDGRISMRLRTPYNTSLRTNSVEDFNLAGVFRMLAQENATQAIEMARSFEREAPRATALIAVARSLLTEKQN
jgi:hypothetical protein